MAEMCFHKKLRMLREKQELTQGQVAKALGLERSTYTYYETGKTQPNLSSLKILAALYHVSVDDLLNDSTDLSF